MMEKKTGFGVRLAERVLGGVLLASLLVGLANLSMRTATGRGLFWAEDVQLYGLVAITFLGAAAVSARGAHLALPSLHASSGSRSWLRNLRILALATSCIAAGVLSTRYIIRLFETGQSSTVGIPLWLPNLVVTAGLLLAGGLALVSVVRGGGDA